MTQPVSDYKADIAALMANYADGYDTFIKNDWDSPLKLNPGHAPGATGNWMDLMERVVGIIGRGKYGLDTYANEIYILDSEQMLDTYTSHGMPDDYTHWRHGKNRQQMGEAHAAGAMNLAYELVINSNPSISYCMTSNSNMMQALVLAHAAQGHNAFFKNNIMFRQFTNADEIRGDLRRLSEFVSACEVKYGIDRVERVLDACHALEMHAIDYSARPPSTRSKKQADMRKAAIEAARVNSLDVVLDTASLASQRAGFRSVVRDEDDVKAINEQNILRYIGKNAPHLEPWERQLIGMFCDRAQYFYPQMRTKVMNEGFASFFHYKIVGDLHELGLISDSMYLEFFDSHTSVVRQHDFTDFNPYALGFAIYADIERICMEPTDEDRRWFPEFAGNGQWLETLKNAAYNYNDETFIYQYLSPKVIRDFHMFALRSDAAQDFVEITDIHDDYGFKNIRAILAANHNIATKVPQIAVMDYDDRHDRALTLKHTITHGKSLEPDNAEEVIKHVYQLWQHPVVLASFNDADEPTDILSCPRNIKGRALEQRLAAG